jgi:hypothetical protein
MDGHPYIATNISYLQAILPLGSRILPSLSKLLRISTVTKLAVPLSIKSVPMQPWNNVAINAFLIKQKDPCQINHSSADRKTEITARLTEFNQSGLLSKNALQT